MKRLPGTLATFEIYEYKYKYNRNNEVGEGRKGEGRGFHRSMATLSIVLYLLQQTIGVGGGGEGGGKVEIELRHRPLNRVIWLLDYLIIWLIVVVVAVAGVCVASSTKDSRLARRASARRAAQEHKDPDRIKVLINYLQYYHFVIVVVVVVPSLSYNIISYYRIITSNTYCKGNDHLWGLIINDYKEITDYKEMEWLNRQAIIDSVWLRWEEEEEAWERVGEMGGGGVGGFAIISFDFPIDTCNAVVLFFSESFSAPLWLDDVWKRLISGAPSFSTPLRLNQFKVVVPVGRISIRTPLPVANRITINYPDEVEGMIIPARKNQLIRSLLRDSCKLSK